MKDKVILIPDLLTLPATIERDVFGPEVEIVAPCATDVSEIDDETWESADAILAWHELQFTADVVRKLKKCKVIVRVGVGFDNIDLEIAGEMGIPVCNVPDYGTNDVADHALGLMLTLARGIIAFNNSIRESNDWDWEAAGKLRRLSGSNLGIIGLGRIGTAFAIRAQALGMNVLFYDPYIPDGQDKALKVTRCIELHQLLEKSDIISIHTPLTQETREMVNRNFLAAMKKDSILVNTARGGIVVLDDLDEALRLNHLQAAGFDVLPIEPPDFTHPLLKAWKAHEPWIANRLVLTPHSAFYNIEAYTEMREKAAKEAKRVLDGRKALNQVNLEFCIQSKPQSVY